MSLIIALDAMGGDHAPDSNVEGACRALEKYPDVTIILLGNEEAIRGVLTQKKLSYPEDRLQIENCTEEIEMAEPPVAAIQKKKDSSIVKGMRMVRSKKADAFISAGSTGAVLVGGQVLVGRLKGVDRPPLGALIPTQKGMSLLVDCGANVDARPSWLLQFAEMGSIYMQNVCHIERPSVGILNIGAEEEKGNALVKSTFPLLKEDSAIHFIGSVEARDVPFGGADVVVCDAFSGNILLKTYEGTAKMLGSELKAGLLSSLRGKLGAALAIGPLKSRLKKFDSKAYGGAPLLGLRGLVVKAHGSSDARAIEVAIGQCVEFYKENINEKIRERFESEAEHFKALKKAELERKHE